MVKLAAVNRQDIGSNPILSAGFINSLIHTLTKNTGVRAREIP
jgi:hypothetical protein